MLIVAGLSGTPATLAKLVAAACIGIALAGLLQTAGEMVAIAVLVAAVDAYSVAAGPTHAIVLHHQQVLGDFTLAFHPPGSYSVAQIGASDFVFFALFTAAAGRLGLRARADLGRDDRIAGRDDDAVVRLRLGPAGAAAAVPRVHRDERRRAASAGRGRPASAR